MTFRPTQSQTLGPLIVHPGFLQCDEEALVTPRPRGVWQAVQHALDGADSRVLEPLPIGSRA